MRIIILSLMLLFSVALQAQRLCLIPQINAPAAQIAGAVTGTFDKPVSGVIRIPVVVHVLYHNDAQAISTAQIQSGIDALNRDFRRRNADTINTPERFKKLAADVEIEFALATVDAAGKATTGIIRKYTAITQWAADDKIKFSTAGGDDAWDAASYLNIWIGNINRSLGYASQPGDDVAKDGIVITSAAFGTIGKTGAYNMGRTLVHETGHWFGLKHIWGDAACGDDGVADTPPQAGFTSGCPISFLSSCSNGEVGDMYMNYMDFTNDACMNLFTLGQKAKMRQQFEDGNARHALLESKGLQAAWASDTTVAPTPDVANGQLKQVPVLKVYPNPASDYITLDVTNETLVGGVVEVISMEGAVALRQQFNGLSQRVAVQSLQPGLYLIQIKKGASSVSGKFIKKP